MNLKNNKIIIVKTKTILKHELKKLLYPKPLLVFCVSLEQLVIIFYIP